MAWVRKNLHFQITHNNWQNKSKSFLTNFKYSKNKWLTLTIIILKLLNLLNNVNNINCIFIISSHKKIRNKEKNNKIRNTKV